MPLIREITNSAESEVGEAEKLYGELIDDFNKIIEMAKNQDANRQTAFQ